MSLKAKRDEDDREELDNLMEIHPICVVEFIPNYEGDLEVNWYTSIEDFEE